ncbi:MAG: class C sortase [Enterococcus sp.]
MNKRNSLSKDEKINLLLKLFMAVMFLAGAIIFIYPFVVDSLNNYLDQQRMSYYQEQMQEENAAQAKEMKQRLAKENAKIKEGTAIPGMGIVADPFEEATKNVQDPGLDYYKQHTIGAIYIPKINVSLPIFDETNATLLDRGATVLQGTSFPIGGQNTHSVITGHSGLAEKVLFTHLEELTIGDQFFVEVADEKLAYQVEAKKVVLPDQLDDVKIQSGRDLVTLVTCTPYSINTHRLLVTGYRIPYEADRATKAISQTQSYHRHRLWFFILGIVLFLAFFVYWIWRKWVYYQASKQTYELIFSLAGQQENLAFQVYDRKGKAPILLTGKPIVTRSDAQGVVQFHALPGNFYQVKSISDGKWPVVQAKVGRVNDRQFRLTAKKWKLKKGVKGTGEPPVLHSEEVENE